MSLLENIKNNLKTIHEQYAAVTNLVEAYEDTRKIGGVKLQLSTAQKTALISKAKTEAAALKTAADQLNNILQGL